MHRLQLFSVLVFLFLTCSVKVGAVNIGAEQLDQAVKSDSRAEDISAWLGQQNYNESRMLSIRFNSQLAEEELLDAFTAAIEDPSLSVTAWFRLAGYCQQDSLSRLMSDSDLIDSTVKEKISASEWCQKNLILQRYQKLDPDNIWAYLIELDDTKEPLYSKGNIYLLEKAANAEFANNYYGQGFNQYSLHLQQYFRLHPQLLGEEADVLHRLDHSMSFDIEDMVNNYVASISMVSMPPYYPLVNICTPDNIPEEKFTESIRSNCLKVAHKMNAGINTMLDLMIANTIIIKLSEPGSEQHKEAVRRKIVERQISICVNGWGMERAGKFWAIDQVKIYTKVLPLYAKYSESIAWARAADAYYLEKYPDLDGKPSDCLLLANLGYDAALKLEKVYKKRYEIQ